MNKTDYRISNIYYMLCYAFRIDKIIEKKDKLLDVENFKNLYDLFSTLLLTMIPKLIKRGFFKDYICEKENIAMVKGKIDLSSTIKKNALLSGKIVCEYDDFSNNVYLNKIIKTTLFFLLKSNKLSTEHKKKVKKTYLYFDSIDTLNSKEIRWTKILLNKSNKEYKKIINICYLILNELIITEESGKKQFKEFINNEKLSVIYERFVREYYKKHFPSLNPCVKNMAWNIDNGYSMIDVLPIMKTDINLYYNNKVLIIDTKFYANILNKSFYGDKAIINRDNWNQLFAYVSNESYGNDKTVSGMLLYAQTEEELLKKTNTSIMNHKMFIRTLDLRSNFISISNELDSIANEFMMSN